MAVSFITPTLYWFLNLGVCQVYPGYRTFLYLYGRVLGVSKGKEKPQFRSLYYAHHFVYWGVYMLYSYFESLFPFHKVVPFYYEMKLLFFFWLGSDHFKGAGYLFNRYLNNLVLEARKFLKKNLDQNVDEKMRTTFTEFLKNLGSPEDLDLGNPESCFFKDDQELKTAKSEDKSDEKSD